MPKVVDLFEKYRASGLQVLGITHDTRQLNVVKQLVKKRGIRFPTLIGNEQVRRDYALEAVPLYVVIDQQGKIRFLGEGFSPKIEETIQTLITSQRN